jgi:hypothetical protein
LATGLSTQLTGKIGEHIVAAELARRGIVATPFSGNVPDIDILAYANGIAHPIQVKAINKDSWQFDIRKFLNVEVMPKGQIYKGKRALNRKIICVFVALGEKTGDEEYYIFRLGWLQDYFDTNFKPRKPPRNINSFHCAIWKKQLSIHLNKWRVIEKVFKLSSKRNV